MEGPIGRFGREMVRARAIRVGRRFVAHSPHEIFGSLSLSLLHLVAALAIIRERWPAIDDRQLGKITRGACVCVCVLVALLFWSNN